MNNNIISRGSGFETHLCLKNNINAHLVKTWARLSSKNLVQPLNPNSSEATEKVHRVIASVEEAPFDLYCFCTVEYLHFLFCLALAVTANCNCEIHCIALDGYNLNTVHKLSSKEKKSQPSWDLNPGLLGGKQE